MLLVVVEDLLDGLNTRVRIALVVFSGALLVPIEDLVCVHETPILNPSERKTYTTNEGRDEGDACLGASDSLFEAKEQSQVAVDTLVTLELASSLDALPGGGDLDQDAILLDANRVVERDELLGLWDRVKIMLFDYSDRTRLGLGRLLVKGKACIYFSRDASGNDGKNFLSELDQLIKR